MRRLVAIAIVAGIVAGCVAAVAIPRERGPAERPLRFGAAHKPPREQPTIHAVPGSVKVELRRADPDGGPRWVLRTFSSRLRFPERFHPGDEATSRQFCVQVLREVDGKLGWIDGTNTFRPAGFGYNDAPQTCTNALPGPTSRPLLEATTLVADLDRPDAARVTRTVVFGFGGRDVRATELRVGKERRKVDVSARGAFIEWADPGVQREHVSVRFDYGGGRGQTSDLGAAAREMRTPSLRLRRPGDRRPRPADVAPAIEARAPDPNGGLPWAMGAVPDRTGGWCLTQNPGRVVGETMGSVDFDVGRIWPGALGPPRCRERQVQKRAVEVGYTFGGESAQMPGADPARGRIARRTLPGTTMVYGRARDDVASLTITTPRDVRTLVPSPRAHAFLAVYDGDFPTGEIVVTAHFKDGRSREADRFGMGGM